MQLISFSQNREDIVLWRALSDVSSGFYIDVGAHDPTEASCTKLFYDRGWSGINIEPAPDLLARLRQERPRDVNLGVAVTNRAGDVVFFADQGVSGFSTVDDTFIAELKTRGHSFSERRVPGRTLQSIVDEHARDREVHFLKVDVEGHERQVLEGADFRRWRPWIVVLEAISPTDWSPTHESWEPLLLEAGYDFALFDGLNRFYLAREHDGLRRKLSYPACVLDGFTSSDIVRMAEQKDSEIRRLRRTNPFEIARAVTRRARGLFGRPKVG
jgi:FkbM family methyltransferase